jgi:3-dehydroquinate synthase
MEKTVRVDLAERSYDVRVGVGLIQRLGEAAAEVQDVSTAAVVSDSRVAELYAASAVESLHEAGLTTALIDFPAGEANKTLQTVARVLDELFAISPAIDRDSLIVALGGGVTGDLAGFVAATALRGLRWLQCPTTLLSAVDASVGGKTGVDHPAGKNLIGAFHQPRGVLIDVSTLKTLDDRELHSGLAECVKHAVIADGEMLEFLEDNVEAILSRQAEVMTDLIARNVRIKASFVSADEREAGRRAHLNFGHTIGHAIEAFVGFGNITHGEAVSLGMVAACRLAVHRELIEDEAAARVADILVRMGLPVRWSGLDSDKVWQIMLHDKKVRGGQVRMVLPVVLGEAAIFSDITADTIRSAVESLL